MKRESKNMMKNGEGRRWKQKAVILFTLALLPSHGSGFQSSHPGPLLPTHTRSSSSSNSRTPHPLFVKNSIGPDNKPPRGWRKAVGKVLRRRSSSKGAFRFSQKDTTATTAMKYSTADVAEADSLGSMLKDFDILAPDDVFPTNMTIDEIAAPYVMQNLEDMWLKDSNIQETGLSIDGFVEEETHIVDTEDEDMTEQTGVKQVSHNPHRTALAKSVVKSWFQGLLLGIIERRSVEPPQNLTVSVFPKGNVLAQVLRGQLRADAEIKIGKACFAPFQFSGGTIEAKRMLLNLWSFTPDVLPTGKTKYQSQFDFEFTDCVLSEEDLFRSRSIRNGLQRLLIRILKKAGVTPHSATVDSIRILGNKIACRGVADTAISGRVPFEVRSSLGASSRGHVMTFPGLEVSLQPSLGIFMPVLPGITLDIGHNARFHSIDVDGSKKTLTFSGTTTVTPEHTLKLKKYLQTRDAFGARFSFDVGQWLTKVGNFTQ